MIILILNNKFPNTHLTGEMKTSGNALETIVPNKILYLSAPAAPPTGVKCRLFAPAASKTGVKCLLFAPAAPPGVKCRLFRWARL